MKTLINNFGNALAVLATLAFIFALNYVLYMAGEPRIVWYVDAIKGLF